MWHPQLNIVPTSDIREKRMSLVPNLEKKIRETNVEIVKLTNHRDSLKKELKEVKQEIDKDN